METAVSDFNFGIENDGTGFGSDETDIDDLLAIAQEGEEDENDNDEAINLIFQNGGRTPKVEEKVPEPTYVNPPPEETYREPEPVAVVEPQVPEIPEVPLEPEYIEPAPVVQQERHFEDPVRKETYTQPERPKRIQMKSEDDSIREIQKAIRILDTYRQLSRDDKEAAIQFICVDSENIDPSDEATLVVKAMYADPMLKKTMKSLRTAASQEDRVERVFYILKLPDAELFVLGDLVDKLIENSGLDKSNDRIDYSKKLENCINRIDNRFIQYVISAESVLSAAEDS